jgi:DHA2 family multidrug resistance protein
LRWGRIEEHAATRFSRQGGDIMSTTAHWRQRALFPLLTLLPFSDFLQTGVVAFNAAPIMGNLGVSPEEFSMAATLYALVAVSVIFSHRWLVERVGWRWFMRGSASLYALGAILCALSQTLTQFSAGRMVMALGCASFFSAGRVLVNLGRCGGPAAGIGRTGLG